MVMILGFMSFSTFRFFGYTPQKIFFDIFKFLPSFKSLATLRIFMSFVVLSVPVFNNIYVSA